MREEFLKQRDERLKKNADLTEKRKDKRHKKKERQKQLRNKMKLLKRLGKDDDSESDSDDKVEPTQNTTIVTEDKQLWWMLVFQFSLNMTANVTNIILRTQTRAMAGLFLLGRIWHRSRHPNIGMCSACRRTASCMRPGTGFWRPDHTCQSCPRA